MTMTRAEVPFSEVLEAARAYIPESGGQLASSDHRLVTLLRERLHVDFTSPGPAGALGHYDGKAQDRFSTQVTRALNRLADEGVLRKAGADTTGPDGRKVYRDQVMFYTPEMWDAIAAKHQQDVADEQARLRRSDRLGDRLRALGVSAGQTTSGELRLDLSQLEALAGLAELGTGLPTHVRFAHPDNGYESSRVQAARYLEAGRVYPLVALQVGQSSSTVELLGLRDLRFSSVMFAPARSDEE